MPWKVLLIATLAFFSIMPITNSVAASGFITNDAALWTTTDTNTSSSGSSSTFSVNTNTRNRTTTPASQSMSSPSYQSARYGYDTLDRLTWVQYEDGTVISYEYDKVGNRMAKNTSSSTLANFTITTETSGYGALVPSGSITIPSGSSQVILIEQGSALSGTVCPDGYTFIVSNNRCEKSPPQCISGYSFNSSSQLCEQTVYSSYSAICSVGTYNTSTGKCEYSASEITVTKTYAPPTGPYGHALSSYDDLREPIWMCGYLVTANPDTRITTVSNYSHNAATCYTEDEVGTYSCDPEGGGCAYIGSTICDYKHNGGWGSTICLYSGGFCTNGVKTIACNITGISAQNPCPSGGSLEGNTCQVSQQCPSGGTLSGTTCTVTNINTSAPICTNGAFEASSNHCYSYPPGTLTSLLVDNVTMSLGDLSTTQGPTGPRYYYTFANISANHTITANFTSEATPFCTDYPARLAGTTPVNYLSLLAAYNSAVNNDTILGNSYDHFESLLLDRNITVTLDGGYSCDYSSRTGDLTVKGELIVSNGTLVIVGSVVLTGM